MESETMDSDINTLPEVTYPDIVNYVLNTKSPYTMNDFRSYKSLGAYNQFVNGWVSDICTRLFLDNYLVIAKVRHSHAIGQEPTTLWLIIEKDGKVLRIHCDCTAGIAETFTHAKKKALEEAIESGQLPQETQVPTKKSQT